MELVEGGNCFLPFPEAGFKNDFLRGGKSRLVSLRVDATRQQRQDAGMKKIPLLALSAFFAAFPACPPVRSQDTKPAAEEDAVFDVEEDPGKTPAAPKTEEPAENFEADLPADAADMLKQLAADEKAAQAQLMERILQNRKTAAGKLTALADKVDVTQRAKILEAVELCGKQPPEARLAQPAGSFNGQWIVGTWALADGQSARTLLPGGRLQSNNQTGGWHWIDAEAGYAYVDWLNSDYVDFIRLKKGSRDSADFLSNHGHRGTLIRSGPDKFSLNDPDVLLSLAARQEEQWRAGFQNQAAAGRAQTYEKLMAQVRTVKGPAGIALLQAAVKLKKPPVAGEVKPLEYADRLTGEWRSAAGRNFTFLPQGGVQESGEPAGTWKWAKYNNRVTLLVILNIKNPQVPETFFARRSSRTPGLLYTYALDAAPGDLTRQ